MVNGTKLMLIGGTSHVGKSTLGQQLADDLGWNYLSTDQLARHPGRPWRVGEREIPSDVVEHYSSLPTLELVESVLLHYRANVWPIIHSIVQCRLNNTFDLGLVFEGSAILPELIRNAGYERVNAVWLTAPVDFITQRTLAESEYSSRTLAEQKLIDAFLQRSIAIDSFLRKSAEANQQELLDTSSQTVFTTLRSLI